MHPEDANARGITDGCLVRIFNDRGETFLRAEIGEKGKRGSVSVFSGAWSGRYPAINVLQTDRDTDIGYGTCFYNCLVQVEAANACEDHDGAE